MALGTRSAAKFGQVPRSSADTIEMDRRNIIDDNNKAYAHSLTALELS